MCITPKCRNTIAALIGAAALTINGTAAASSNGATGGSAARTSRTALLCVGMIRGFQADVVEAAVERGAGRGTSDLAWRNAALRAASSWLGSGCF